MEYECWVPSKYDRRDEPFATATYGTQKRQIGSWYADEAWTVFHENSWYHFGGCMFSGTGAGVFAFVRESAHPRVNDSFRIVLSV